MPWKANRTRNTNRSGTTMSDKEMYGRVIWQAARSKWWVVPTSLLYALLSAVLILYAMHGAAWLFVPVAASVAFFLWRIYEVQLPVVLATESRLLIANGFSWDDVMKGHFPERDYIAVSYTEIVGFSHRFTEMYIGAPAEGGLAKISVPFAMLSPKNKRKLVALIEEKQGA